MGKHLMNILPKATFACDSSSSDVRDKCWPHRRKKLLATTATAVDQPLLADCQRHRTTMATPFLVGLGTIGAALVGRHLLRNGARAGEKWVQGGFKAKMDRKEAIAILGLKCVNTVDSSWTSLTRDNSHRRSSTEYKVEGRPPSNHDRQPPRPWWIPIPREQNKRSKRLTGEDRWHKRKIGSEPDIIVSLDCSLLGCFSADPSAVYPCSLFLHFIGTSQPLVRYTISFIHAVHSLSTQSTHVTPKK